MARSRPAAEQIETERLLLRRWVPADEAAMMEINREPEVVRYLNRAVDVAAVGAFLAAAQAHWDRHGFGLYAVQRRSAPFGRALLGFTGIAFPGFLPQLAHRPELGWRLRSDAWGLGYATEAARAVRSEALERVGLEDLISIIHPDNRRSERVAEKLGMAVEMSVYNPVLRRDVNVWSLAARAEGAPGAPLTRKKPS